MNCNTIIFTHESLYMVQLAGRYKVNNTFDLYIFPYQILVILTDYFLLLHLHKSRDVNTLCGPSPEKPNPPTLTYSFEHLNSYRDSVVSKQCNRDVRKCLFSEYENTGAREPKLP